MSPLRVGTVLLWIRQIDEAIAFLRKVPPEDQSDDPAFHAYYGLQSLRDDLLLLSVGEEIVDVTQPPAPPDPVP